MLGAEVGQDLLALGLELCHIEPDHFAHALIISVVGAQAGGAPVLRLRHPQILQLLAVFSRHLVIDPAVHQIRHRLHIPQQSGGLLVGIGLALEADAHAVSSFHP